MDADSQSLTTWSLHPRAIIRVSGPDRERFLNGQVTQDVRLATGRRVVQAALLNAKGQLEAICWIRNQDDSYLLDAPVELREDLLARLDRYLIADDVELSDESDHWHLTLLRGPVPEEPARSYYDVDRTGVVLREALTQEPLKLDPAQLGDHRDLERERIVHGIPVWGAELTPGLLPPEAGLDRTAISYDKGCYLGQEVISRMKRAGKTNKHLVRLSAPAGTTPGTVLVHEGQEAGLVTSVAQGTGAEPSVPALGFRKRKFEAVPEFSLRDEAGNLRDGMARLTAS